MDKTSEYWKLHKKIYQEMLFNCENNSIEEITSNPKCVKAKRLESLVHERVKEELRKKMVDI